MKSVSLSSFLILLAVFALPVSGAAADDFATIVSRYRELLLSGHGSVTQQSGKPDEADARKWIATLSADGRWPDIDYTNRAGGAWETLTHLRRVRTLAKNLADRRSPLFQNAAAQKTALRALDHWTAQRYQNPNWWQNQIGVPQVMRDIVVLLGEGLSGESRAGAMAVLHQFVLQPPAVGANTVWAAELALFAAALERDEAALANASQLVAGEIVLGAEQGIQDDYSFHQHGARLQQFHYGASFFEDTVHIAWLLRETRWNFPAEKTRLLADYAVEGNAWMSRGRVTVPGTLDRAVSRPGAMRWADLRPTLALLAEALPERRAELNGLQRMLASDNRGGDGDAFRAFPRSDFAVLHSPALSVFLKTISTRTEVTETLLRENRRGKKLNWGDHYVLTAHSDYVDLPPVWDWELLPGVTSATDIDTIQRRPFVGGIGDRSAGAAVMDYATGRGETTTLTARKFWAMDRGMVVGLIGALQRTDTGEPVRTALDQRRWRGPVTIADAHGVSQLEAGRFSKTGVRWILHDGLLYVPLGSEPITFSLGPVTGSWNDVNLNYSTATVTESIFLPVLEHGATPQNAASGFVILPCDSVTDAKKLAKNPRWTVLRNDAGAQAVKFSDKTWMAAMYAAGKVAIARDLEVGVDAPCLLYFRDGELRASDPTQLGLRVQVRVGPRDYTLTCPAGGKTSEPVRL